MERAQEIIEFDQKFLDAADAYQNFAEQAEAEIRPTVIKMMQAYEVSAKGTSEETAEAWKKSLEEFFRPIFKVHTDLIAYVAANESELRDIGIEPNVFAHNLGSLTLNRSMHLSSGLHVMAMMQKVGRDEPRDFGHNAILPYFIPELLEQTANHLRSIVVRRKLLSDEAIDMSDAISPEGLYRTVAGSRALHDDTIPQSSIAIFEDHGISLPEKTFVNYLKIKGSIAAFEDWKSSRPVVESILYYLMSNATKKLQKYKRTKPEITPIVETTWYPLQFEKTEFVALEVFDNGPHINIDALYQALAKTLESPHQVAQGVANDTMAQLQDLEISRQTDLTQIISPADLPFLRGFSGQGSSGIGMDETKFLTAEGGGAIMINNVYGSETGVAVTVLFPKDNQDPKGLKKLNALAEEVKNLLQTGQFSLSQLEKAA